MADPVLFKIFLSSPGDVPQERNDAETVVKEINESGEFSHHFILKLYRWDDKAVVLPMPVTDIPQKSVDVYMIRPSVCDLVVVLFWSRMGSPLVMDEREYLSGTHYEYSEALQGYKQLGKPTIWLYRCAEEPSIKLSDPKRDEKIQQFDRVEQFFKQFQDLEGRYTAGVNSYDTHTEFKALLRNQLITYLRHLRDTPQQTISETPNKPNFSGVPYRGLMALDESDAPIFFGRDAETLEVLNRVESKRLVFVLGASGSGKSSLVAAGVLPKLRERGWRIVRFVPGDDPFYSVARALVSQVPEMGVKPTDYLTEARKLADTLGAKPTNLAEQIALTLPKVKVLLFIDQFEEVFTLAANNPNQTTFIQAIRSSSKNLTLLLTMRADFYGAALPHFEELKQEAYGLTRPSPFALYEMIIRPAELAGLKWDDGLAKQIVLEAGNESGGLALISYVLEALYLRAKTRGDGRLSKHDYEIDLNGVRGAINTLADQAYAALPFQENARQSALQTVFRELIAITEEDGQLIPTRKRAMLSLFQANSNEGQLIETFVRARLLVKDSQSVEVAHEAILKQWNALATWIGKNITDLALYRQYERDAKMWADRGKDTPLPMQEVLVYFYKALANLHIDRDQLKEPLNSYTEPELSRLLRELETMPRSAESHQRRRDIGDRLSVIGDTRPGVNVRNGIPDIVWLPFTDKGKITIEKHSFDVGPFYVAKYLVTHIQYQTFVDAEDGYDNNVWWTGIPKEYQRQFLSHQHTRSTNNPRDNISWYQSVAFSRWLDSKLRQMHLLPDERLIVRLPTDWEWQWAAQAGVEQRPYPWGEWKEGYANTEESGLSRATAVGMYPHGAAVCGAMDMAGNLSEWCLNDYQDITRISLEKSYSKVLRGGSFLISHTGASTSYRNYYDEDFGYYHYFGFRVVAGPPIDGI